MIHLYQIEAPHFTAGLLLGVDGKVRTSAPIISYLRNWPIERVRQYCLKKRWSLSKVEMQAPATDSRRKPS